MDHVYKFALGQKVTIAVSGETGEVRGRTEYLNCEYPDIYWLRYKAADGRAAEDWQAESALVESDGA